MNWKEHLQQMDDEALRDLCGYLYGSEKAEKLGHDSLVQSLLQGKYRYVFELIDKSAYKTLRRLYRHPDRPVYYDTYPVDQLLSLHMIEEIPSLYHEKTHGWYRIKEEALMFVQKMYSARHYDALLNKMEEFDEILMGLFHTFGLLELHQCVEMLAMYGIDITPQRLFSSISWRLSIREYLQAFQLNQHGACMSFIILRDLDLSEALQAIVAQKQYEYTLCDKASMRKRCNRYYTMESIELVQLMEQLKVSFTKRFAIDVAKELIDTYQYHCTSFTREYMIYRVMKEEDIKPYLELAIHAIPDLYCKGHVPNK